MRRFILFVTTSVVTVAVCVLLLGDRVLVAAAGGGEAPVTHKLVRYKEKTTTDDKANGLGTLDAVVYADLKAPRIRKESVIKHPDGDAVLIDSCDTERHLMTNSRAKTAWLGRGNKSYKSFLGGWQIFQQRKGVTSGKDKLGGRETVKYRLEEDNHTVSLWVDAKTKLPVRVEEEFIDPTPTISSNKFVWSNFEWDPELPKGSANLDQLFSTQPPDGYTLDDQSKKDQ